MATPNPLKRRRSAAAQRLAQLQPIRWEACEPRLVLSAQLLGDLIDPHQLQMHGAIDAPLAGVEAGTAPFLEPHTAQAHQLSGWNAMQHEFGLKGDGQTVVVIDSGIAWDHVALGKGFGAGYRVVGGWDFAENDANPYDDGPTGFHGTHVAGIIGSDNAKTSGVAPNVDLVGLRVFNDAGQGQIEWVEQALNWVHTHRDSFANPITTVNLSLGTTWNADSVPSWGTLEEELRQLYDDGIVVTASAGNSFKQYNAPGLSYPAASPYVLPVASVDDNGSLSDFSQRNGRVLAAPGRNILSTVPDHVLGRDGKIDDFSTASGTSMAAPYVAGASALVREAMQMVGIQDITATKIMDWLHDTADTVYDSLTSASYDRLNLQTAIDTLIPDDDVGDSTAQAQPLNLSQKSLSGWVNRLGDTDVYRFTTSAAGQFTLDADSQWLDSLRWDLSSNGQSIGSGSLASQTFHLQGNQTYELHLAADQEIGPFQLGLNFQADPTPPSQTTPPPPATLTILGSVDYMDREVAAGTAYRATAMHDGIFTVQWTNPDAALGSLSVRDAAGVSHTDATWEAGVLRLDLSAKAGQSFEFQLPGAAGDAGNLIVADVVDLRAGQLKIHDTSAGDNVQLDLSRGVGVDYNRVHYDFQAAQVSHIAVDGAVNNDQLSIIGSALADKVDLKPSLVTLENTSLSLVATGVEQVHFDSGTGGPDRVYLYDSDGNDTLNARPGSAELIGAGYRFSVEHVDRVFVHATGQGEDLAYLYDSAGDDQLSVRPQFTSMWGDGYFNSIRGFERVYVYATAGGTDTADLYDSSGDDRFSTGGEAASIVGNGFFSYTRYFEQVYAHATAGGHDVATLYGSNQQTEWQRGSDFISYRETSWDRNAQGFEKVEAYIAGQSQSQLSTAAIAVGAEPAAAASNAPEVDVSANLVMAPQADDALLAGSFQPAPASFVAELADERVEPSPAPQAASAMTDDEHAIAARLLVEALELQDSLALAPAVDELRWHADPAAERQLLDEIFSRFGQ